MDFYSAQDEAHARTRRLVGMFALAVLLTILAVHLGVELLLSWRSAGQFAFSMHWAILPWTAGVTLVPIVLGVLWKWSSLSGGGSVVAEAMGGRRVATDTSDFLEKRLLNVVEEVAIASGVRVPEVWVLEEEQGINAFAAGTDPAQAAVAVSRGCLECLDRDELQGVVGHEFSHILNGDMRLNLQMMAWISGILALSVLGQILIRLAPHLRSSGGGGRRKASEADSLPLILFVSGLGFLVIGSVGAFFARWIQAAISRQREFLADASAVQFTRNPQGISGALRKIGGYAAGSRLEAARSAEVAHMVFCDGASGFFSSLFATHPPLEERIARLDPDWQGGRVAVPVPEGLPSGASSGHGGTASGFTVGHRVAASRAGQKELPGDFEGLARNPRTAGRVVLELLEAAESGGGGDGSGVSALALAEQMVLLDLALSAARQLSREEVGVLLDACERQVVADGEFNLFEMMLLQSVRRHLGVAAGLRAPAAEAYAEAASLREAFQVILSATAALGGGDASEQDLAFLCGWEMLSLAPVARFPVGEIPVQRIADALLEMERGSFVLRGLLVRACYKTVSTDRVIQELEAAFVRAVGDAVGVPVPPMAPS